MYLFLVAVQCTLALLLQLNQTPTDSSYKPSFKKKTDQEQRNNGTNLRLFSEIQGNSGATVAITKSIFFQRCLGASPQHYNAVFFYISIILFSI